jgi:2'-5' RNA ligase
MALPPGAKPRALNQDALMAQMQAQQSPEKQGTPMFSPGAPLQPSPGLVNPGGPRQYVFPVGYNIQSQPRSTESTSFDVLRNLAQLYDGIQLCEQVWLDTVAKLTLVIKPRDEIIAEQGKSAATQKYSAKIRKYADFFAYPDVGNGYDLKAWLRAAIRDQLQLDAVAIYVRRNRGGGVYSLELVQGESIKPLIDARGRRPQPPFPAYQQFLYGVPAGLYTSDEMLYQRETVRTESIYGLSRVERIILRINQALRKENKDLARFTDGNVPPGIMSPPDDGSQWTPEQLMTYQEMWDALLAGNDQARSRIKVIQPGSTLNLMQEPDIFVDFDRFLLNVTAACYSMTMSDLGFTESVNKSSGESQENVFYRRACQPLMDRYATLFSFILRYYFGEQDLVVGWSGFEESEDFNAMAASYVALTGAGITSPTVAAHQMNLPWSGPEIPNYVMSKDGPVFLEDAAQTAMRQAVMQAKIAGLTQIAQPPANSQDNDANSEATESNEKQQMPPGSVGKNRGSTPPGFGAKSPGKRDESNEKSSAKDDAKQAVKRADDSADLRPGVVTEHTGIMIAFMVKPETASQLALPDGEPAQDMHVTLAFMGDINDTPRDGYVSPVEALDVLRMTLASFASHQEALSGTTGGIGRFTPSDSSDNASPVIALVNVPGLQEFRRQLVEALSAVGYFVHNDFDFTPHCTLMYADPSAPMPIDDLPTLPLIFDELCLAIGDDRYFFPLGPATPSPTVEITEQRSDLPDIQRDNPRAWRPPSETQLALESKLSKAVKAFIDQTQITRDGVTIPDEAEQTRLLEEITELLTEAIHEGRRVATGLEERALISALKNLAGRAVQLVGEVIEQLKEKAQGIIEDLLGGPEGFDDVGATSMVSEALDEWASDYSEMVGITEITAAVEEAVLDQGIKQGHTQKYWNAEPDACERCRQNADASPIDIKASFPDGSSSPPGHVRCRCSQRTS